MTRFLRKLLFFGYTIRRVFYSLLFFLAGFTAGQYVSFNADGFLHTLLQYRFLL